jgi:hypothetical protein
LKSAAPENENDYEYENDYVNENDYEYDYDYAYERREWRAKRTS